MEWHVLIIIQTGNEQEVKLCITLLTKYTRKFLLPDRKQTMKDNIKTQMQA